MKKKSQKADFGSLKRFLMAQHFRRCFSTLFIAVLLICSTDVFAQTNGVTVQGTVKDDIGEALPGVTVFKKGSTSGTITDIDGKFSIAGIKSTDILVFSFIGMETQEIQVENKTKIDVVLSSGSIGLDEVVAVGYGIQKKSDVTGALTRVSADDLQEMPVKDALQGMQGKASGVDIVNNQRPGETGSITIRGVRSLSASNSPLFVVDGMIQQSGGIENINPSDIESIDILKDASATAVYGSRGANGVVLVTTKQGKDGKVTVNYNGSYTVSTMHDVTEMMDGSEWIEYSRQAYINAGSYGADVATYSNDLALFGGVAESWANVEQAWNSDHTVFDPSLVGNYDWTSLGKQVGITQDHTISVSGGNEKFKGYASMGYYTQTGTVKGQDYDRYSSKLSFEANPVDWFTMGATANISFQDQNYGYTGSGSGGAGDYYGALRGMLPWTVPYDSTGELIREPNADSNIINPIEELIYNTNSRQTFRFTGSIYSQINFGNIWKPLDGLSYRIQFGPEYKDYLNGKFNDARGQIGAGLNVARKITTRNIAWTLDNIVSYNKTVSDMHKIGLTLMQSTQKYKSDGTDVMANVATSEELWNSIGSAADIQGYGTSLTEKQMESYMVRANYGLKDRYLLTASVRMDGASQLAEGHKWATFPSLALGWRLDQERFMQSIDAIDQLKLRVGYGVTGNAAISAYATKGNISTTYYNWNGNTIQGYLPSDPTSSNPPKMANKDLGWERTTQVNFGIDYSFLRRVSGSVDYYTTNTNDLLMVMSIPSLTGYTSTYANVGETKGWGIDLQINTSNIKSSNFEWSTNLTWSKDKSEIVKLANGREEMLDNGWFVGEEISVYYDYVYDGVWKTEEAAEAAKYDREPGQIRVKDLNEDDAIDATNDKKIIGNGRPDWTAGMTNSFKYKNWDLSFFLFSRWGQTLPVGSVSLNGRYASRKIDYWVEGVNEDAEYYKPGIVDTYKSSQGYQDGSFIKLRNINLGYTFNNRQLKKIGIGSLNVYMQCVNPCTVYSAIDWLDPDLRDYTGGSARSGSSVTIRSYVFGVKASF
ncbi:SusC/RagA family TonB-linked outer membrane protein [Plebeiibacterium marinum]|uniref:TonB-dependent receptor n=1 Tax=Plebeiibacterium marinum TaxID=2992111 RepID=A0AAE3SLE6_9BACT|nr:TonB-dependent receptor [Plebeiobacterium marinum]MCW3807369.1 TonB-dependent receptor [Plebeiobacterium marinum]